MRVIAIDPGLDGAVCIMNDDDIEAIIDTPTYTKDKRVAVRKKKGVEPIESGPKTKLTKARKFDALAMAAILDPWAGIITDVVIELVGPHRGEGTVSSFGFGFGAGLWHGICAGKFEVHAVTPAVWKKAMGLNKATKHESLVLARGEFPGAMDFLRREKDDGRAEAILMALYWQRKNALSNGVVAAA